MDSEPPWFEDGPPTTVLETIRERRETVSNHRSAFLEAMAADEYSRAVGEKRAFQLAVFKRRQAEGELLWAALGHAIADLASDVSPASPLVERRGDAIVDWAIDATELASIDSRERFLLVVARRSPTLPAAHAPYLEAMFGVSSEDIVDIRERDRSRLETAGWKRETGRGGSVALVSCPHCGKRLPVERSADATVTVTDSFAGSEQAMQEFCPHCEREVYVTIFRQLR